MRVDARRLQRFFSFLATVAVISCGPAGTQASSDEPTIRYDSEAMYLDSTAHIALEPIRVFGGSPSGGGPLYRPVYVALDSAGNVFVADNGHKSVVHFAQAGQLLGTFGRPGQGPGEVQATRGITVARGRVFLLSDRARVNVWDLAGNHIRDFRMPHTGPFLDLAAFDDGTLVTSYSIQPRNPGARVTNYIDQVISSYRVSEDSIDESHRLAVTPRVFPTSSPSPVAHPTSLFAVDPSGRIYLSDSRAYEISAIDVNGNTLWRVQAEVVPPEVTEEDIEKSIKPFESRGLTRSSYTWPTHFPVMNAMRVDGHGHLYVYRFIRNDSQATRIPVDIYARDGNHLFSGTIDRKRWSVGHEDFVYAFEDDDTSGGRVLIAYRLREPFEEVGR